MLSYRSAFRFARPTQSRVSAWADPVSAAGSLTTQIDSGETPTFGFFVAASGNVPFDPAANRIFVRFKDSGGAVRGATSVAVKTQ